jgi:hypothetical protein
MKQLKQQRLLSLLTQQSWKMRLRLVKRQQQLRRQKSQMRTRLVS